MYTASSWQVLGWLTWRSRSCWRHYWLMWTYYRHFCHLFITIARNIVSSLFHHYRIIKGIKYNYLDFERCDLPLRHCHWKKLRPSVLGIHFVLTSRHPPGGSDVLPRVAGWLRWPGPRQALVRGKLCLELPAGRQPSFPPHFTTIRPHHQTQPARRFESATASNRRPIIIYSTIAAVIAAL